ncbi:MAG: cytochrome c biogenesis heme-transporting ATPase CcmA [Casimicrobiaceae bacterium]
MPNVPALEAHSLAASRGYATLFSGLSFGVGEGDALTVRGPNGSGKTTLLRILAGLTEPAGGEVRWRNERMRVGDSRLRSAVAFNGHLAALKDELTVQENLAAWSALDGNGAGPGERAQALAGAGLAQHAKLPARALSQGQRRRIGLARLALSRHPMWILDEPLTALDSDAIALLQRLLSGYLVAGGVVVAASHAPLPLPAAHCRELDLAASRASAREAPRDPACHR